MTESMFRLTRNKPPAIRDRQLHRRRRRALVVPGRVARVPDEDARHAAVHADRHEEGHPVLDPLRVHVSDDRVADDRDGEDEKHDDAAEAQAVGDDGADYYIGMTCQLEDILQSRGQ